MRIVALIFLFPLVSNWADSIFFAAIVAVAAAAAAAKEASKQFFFLNNKMAVSKLLQNMLIF